MFNGFDLSTISDAKIGNTQINQIYYGSQLIWPAGPPHDYSQDYLTFVSLENNNTIEFYDDQGISTRTISISTDDGITWTQKTSAPNGTVLATLNAGERLLIKGSNSRYTTDTNPLVYCTWFYPYKECSVEGNIMSLIYSDNFIGQNTLTDEYTFGDLFSGKIKYANNLVLPATVLTEFCYIDMFAGCSDLLTAPTILPATTLANGCYEYMFLNCYNLTTTPVLPATTLAASCYENMFKGCTALTTGPILPATTLATGCYSHMFEACSLLITAPSLPATTLAGGCYYGMFEGCFSLTTAPALPATTLVDDCYLYMFRNCTALKTAPELLATTLVHQCYQYMFEGCSKLNYIKCLATNISTSTWNTRDWVNGVSSTGTFVKDANTTWQTGSSGIPTNWTVVNN